MSHDSIDSRRSNLELADELETVAKMLREHPDWPAFAAYISGGAPAGACAREMLIRFAEELPSPEESADGRSVEVRQEFLHTTLRLYASVDRVGGRVPRQVEYPELMRACPGCSGSGGGVGSGTCDACEGRGWVRSPVDALHETLHRIGMAPVELAAVPDLPF